MKKLFLSLYLLGVLHASELDLGFGMGFMAYPDYVGSESDNLLVIPYPYFSYHSEKLDIDREGLKSKLFNNEHLSLEISASGSLPVESRGIREGMNDLDPALEIGPALLYDLYNNHNLSIKIDLPLRAVVSTDFKGVDYHGLIYEARAEFEYLLNGYDFQLQTGPVWADKKYNNYLYGVNRSEVTNQRAFYEGESGYSGYKTSVGVSKHFEKFWTGAFIRHYNLSHVAFDDSPLKRKNSALYGGLFVAYIFDDTVSRSLKKWLE